MAVAKLRRVGLLTALPQSDGVEPAVALGDVEARHIRMTPAGLRRYLGDAPGGFVPWREVREVAFTPPVTWFPIPALADLAGPLLEAFFGGGGGATEETPSVTVRMTTGDGERAEWPATQHYLSGYRRRDAKAAVALVEHLVRHPDARVLLARPVEMLDRLSRIVRGPVPPAPPS